MKTLIALLAGLAALLLPAASNAAPPHRAIHRAAAPVARDWSKVARRLPNGDFVEGNPDAKVKLVEFLSFTCPHCQHFEAEGIGPLTAKYIRTGLVSYEVRHALRDPFDLVATLLSRCQGPQAFFAAAPLVFARQADWMEKAGQWAGAKPKLDGLKPAQQLQAAAEGSGLEALFVAQGAPRAKLAACLADDAEAKRLADAAQAIWQPGFPGTPAFLINGIMADNVIEWPALDAKIAQALH